MSSTRRLVYVAASAGITLMALMAIHISTLTRRLESAEERIKAAEIRAEAAMENLENVIRGKATVDDPFLGENRPNRNTPGPSIVDLIIEAETGGNAKPDWEKRMEENWLWERELSRYIREKFPLGANADQKIPKECEGVVSPR